MSILALLSDHRGATQVTPFVRSSAPRPIVVVVTTVVAEREEINLLLFIVIGVVVVVVVDGGSSALRVDRYVRSLQAEHCPLMNIVESSNPSDDYPVAELVVARGGSVVFRNA